MSSHPSNVVELTQALVRIPSVNADGDPGTEHVGEAECAAFVAEFLRSCGADAVLEEVLPGRPNVIGRFPTDAVGKPKIVFGPHTDTVGVGGMVIDPFGGELRDGRVWGRGASDTKGPMAAMLWALKEMGPAIAELPVEVHFAGFMSEESSQHGSRHFAAHHPDYAFALVGEPTQLKTVLKHKGCLWADVITSGIAAHGATPELGENAILKMAHLISALDGDFRRLLASEGGTDELLGVSTVNIGMIQGGTRSNIVADSCTLRLDIRETPALHARGGAQPLLTEFVRRLDATAQVVTCSSAMPLDTDASNSFVQKLVAAGATITGAPWFCDAAYLADKGIPSIAIGPGSIAQAHTKDEWISVTDLEDGVAFFKNFLHSLATGS
jgi:acetylornithine deacetylase/succinyl-diaminopimelate desuccinylase-like protein